MKKFIPVLLCFAIIISFSGCSSNKDSNVSSETTTSVTTKNLTNIQNDAYIIYSLTSLGASQLNGTSSNSIKIDKTSTKTTYTFVDYVLSCGTYMNGEILDEVNGNIQTRTGSFNVTKNPYGISDLKLNITTDIETNKNTGYLNANGEEVDINSKFTSPN